MITLYINYKDGTTEFIYCDQITKTSKGNIVIEKGGKTEETIPAEQIDFFGVWTK